MTAALPAGGLPDGDFYGRPTVRLESDSLWLEALADQGPRIVRFGPKGGESIFAELPETGWETPEGRYENPGGHRLWYAPETLIPGVPDRGLTFERTSLSLRLAGVVDAHGLRRTITVTLDAAEPVATVVHRIANEGDRTYELALWAITQLKLGGVAVVPQPPVVRRHAIVANRHVVLWPYSAWEDERLIVADGFVAIEARPAPAEKAGCLSERGVVAYLRSGLLYVKRFEPAADQPHADWGCNVEMYSDENAIEVETLGPLITLAPGATAEHAETWELRPTAQRAADRESLRALAEQVAGR